MREMATKKYFAVLLGVVAFVLIQGDSARGQPVIAAYQKIYAMNFEVWRPEGLPPGWYVTFDGYSVAQVSVNHWVYGRSGSGGSLVPTDVAVGSVVPMDVPELARVTVSLWRSGACDTRAFRAVTAADCDNMGVLGDPMAYTPVAWKTGGADLMIWLGDRWYRISPAAGESTMQALQVRHPFVVRTLQEKNVVWTRSDTEDLADLSREWGYIWRGTIPFASLVGYRQGGGDGAPGGGSVSFGSGSGGAVPGGGSGGGQWDIGGDGGGSGAGGNGGGWDTGGGTSPGGNGGGWDSGSGNGNNNGNNGGTPSNGGGNNGGGWDK